MAKLAILAVGMRVRLEENETCPTEYGEIIGVDRASEYLIVQVDRPLDEYDDQLRTVSILEVERILN